MRVLEIKGFVSELVKTNERLLSRWSPSSAPGFPLLFSKLLLTYLVLSSIRNSSSALPDLTADPGSVSVTADLEDRKCLQFQTVDVSNHVNRLSVDF